MTDTPETHDEPAPPSPLMLMLRKLLFTLGILLVAWLLLTQVAAKFLFPAQPLSNVAITGDLPPEEPMAEEPEPVDIITQLETRVAQLEARLKVFEETFTSPSPANSANPEVSEEEQKRMAQLEETIGAQEAMLQDVKEKLDLLRQHAGSELTILSAFSQLKQSVQRGEPYPLALAELKKALQTKPDALALLENFTADAQGGAITLVQLQTGFNRIISSNPAALQKPGTFTAAIASMVRIRKVGAPTGSDDESILARAESQLNLGNVGKCLEELAGLSPAAADNFAVWAAEAKKYQSQQSALSELELLLSQQKPAAASE